MTMCSKLQSIMKESRIVTSSSSICIVIERYFFRFYGIPKFRGSSAGPISPPKLYYAVL